MATNAWTYIEPSTELSPLVHRILGANPGFYTLRGTNTYLVGSGERKILIDTGDPNIEAYTSELKKVLGKNQISCIICTHHHHDHVGGVQDVISKVVGRRVPVYKLKRGDEIELEYNYRYVKDGKVFTTEGATLRAVATPGHTNDHLSLYLEEENALFSGDAVVGEGTPGHDDLYDSVLSLRKMLSLNASRIYPGHGPVVENPAEKIEQLLTGYEIASTKLLEAMGSKEVVSSADILSALFDNTNVAYLTSALRNTTGSEIKHFLKKLIKENKVRQVGADSFRRVAES